MEVGVAADNPSVKCVVSQFSGACYLGVVVAQRVQPAYTKGVYDYVRRSFAKCRVGVGMEGELVYCVYAEQLA